MPHHLTSKGQGAPWQNGMHDSNYPRRWAHRLDIINHLCPENKWWATSVFRSPWPQWGHLLQSQDAHCGGSCPWICTLPLLHKVGHPPWILVDCSWSGIQPTHNFQQPLQKMLFPAFYLWPCLFSRHFPKVDGPDPGRVPRMQWNQRWHHCPWSYQSRTQCLSMEPHVCCLQVQVSVQPIKNTCKGPSCQFLWLSLWCWWCPPRSR